MALFGIAIFLIIVAIAAGVVNELLKESPYSNTEKPSTPTKYQYQRKKYFLTKAEKDFYDKLAASVGNECVIFAQVHLSSILDHEVNGQSWKGALSHIQRKSVDFLICDKKYLSPKIVIELDDYTHSWKHRQERDEIVNTLLQNSGIKILRISPQDAQNIEQITSEIRKALS